MSVRDSEFIAAQLREMAAQCETMRSRAERLEREVYDGDVHHDHVVQLMSTDAVLIGRYLGTLAELCS